MATNEIACMKGAGYMKNTLSLRCMANNEKFADA